MTYQEKLRFIDDAATRLSTGLSWQALQYELKSAPGLYQKDIDDINRKVVKSVESAHGPRIHDALMAGAETIDPAGLDAETFQKIRTRQEDTIRNTLKNRIARDLVKGVPAAEVLTTHTHPLLTEEDLRKAVRCPSSSGLSFS